MRLKIVLVLVITAFNSLSLFSQEQVRQFGLGTGIFYKALKSDLISPYTHNGASVPFQIFLRIEDERNRHHLQILYASLTLESSSGGLTTSNKEVSIQYAYHRKIVSLKKKISLLGGAVLSVNRSDRDNNGNGPAVGNNRAGETIGSFNPSLLAEILAGRGKVGVQGWISLFELARQYGYALSYPVQVNWLGMDNFMGISSRVSYSKQISSRIYFRFDYQLEFFKMTTNEPIATLSHRGIISLAYKY